ncbi:DNA repair protein RadA [Bacteroidetes bacterium SCGC AAA795-G10]|nr:DNA repair protein RadA [Bacteroidetes bacterium SCGC AAA795-G10]
MVKIKKGFFCKNCGAEHNQWQGQCKVCKDWNTITEEVISKKISKDWKTDNLTKAIKPIRMDKIGLKETSRFKTGDEEFDRVLGGGLVQGGVVLLGGEPGIGKSTLLLQIALQINSKVLYISGEESQEQIKSRAKRMGLNEESCYVLCETDIQLIFLQIQSLTPEIIIVDSIQTLHDSDVDNNAGSITQIRSVAAELIRFAKSTNIPVILIGHITKDGTIAGPKILEHMVDTVIQFEGDRNHVYRILRVQKNRFGATSEIGIYEMIQKGLRQVINPSEVLISEKEKTLSGHAIAATIEGIRPLMIEVQALVSTAVYGTPQRSCTGFNSKRLNMLLAVLEKRAGFNLVGKDVFINITGGISVVDPALDLAVIAAILSSCHDIPISQKLCFASEIGLSGELRPISKTNQRIQEAEKLGFEGIFISSYTKFSSQQSIIRLHQLSKVESLVNFLF